MATVNPAPAELSELEFERDSLEIADKRTRHRWALLVIAGAQLMVVLDSTIVNVALPHIQTALHFTPTSLTWVLNAYTLAFGGLLLLGGRLGDVLGRRRMFMVGVSLFTLGSVLAGVAPNAGFLLFGRVVQGLGGAIASPTALSLIANTFDEGPERNKAMGVYAAVSGGGAAIGLILGGLLTNLDWRYIFIVNLPIGIALVALAPRVLPESAPRPGRFDLVGAVSSTLGLSALVYGFIHAAQGIQKPSGNGWTEPLTIASFAAAVALLAFFVWWESRTAEPLLPLRLFGDLTRSGSYLLMLTVGSALFGMFFFVTLFVQNVLGFSALKSGFAFLPVAIAIGITAQIASVLINRVGARPLLLSGTVALTAGLLWLSRMTADSTYLGGLLGPMLLIAAGLGFIFVPVTIAAVAGVSGADTGVASAMVNVGQQVGGSLGLSLLLTVTVTSSKSYAKAHHPAGNSRAAVAHFTNIVTAHGYAAGFLAAAVLGVVGIVVTAAMIRVRKEDVAAAGAVHVG